MHTQPHPRHRNRAAATPPPLRAVPDPAPVDDVLDAITAHGDTQALADVDPENKLIQALLNAPAAEAAAVLALIGVDDLAGHLPQVALTAITELVRGGRRPTPDAVAALARGPLPIDPQPSHLAIVRYISDVYTSRIAADLWPAAERVLQDTYCRAHAEHGTRLAQIAETFPTADELDQATARARRHWDSIRERLDHLAARASTPSPHPG
ncbi:hypothetical protein [Nocardia tengchongensis]|uniref:hypothetical protein n=1 Tax=Nocardia tengchongensis TaxID=2055889 RepID=UPI00361D0C08